MRSSLKVAFALTAALGLGAAEKASANFSGAFDPTNWTLTTNNGNGSVDTSGAPAMITLFGSNNSSASSINTDYSIVILPGGDGVVEFDWMYHTDDFFGFGFDPVSVFVNTPPGTPNVLDPMGNDFDQMGHFMLSVVAGDNLVIRIAALDDSGGAASFKVSNFTAVDPGQTTSGTTTGGQTTGGQTTGGQTTGGHGAIPEPVTSTLGLMCLAALGTKLTRRPARA